MVSLQASSQIRRRAFWSQNMSSLRKEVEPLFGPLLEFAKLSFALLLEGLERLVPQLLDRAAVVFRALRLRQAGRLLDERDERLVHRVERLSVSVERLGRELHPAL